MGQVPFADSFQGQFFQTRFRLRAFRVVSETFKQNFGAFADTTYAGTVTGNSPITSHQLRRNLVKRNDSVFRGIGFAEDVPEFLARKKATAALQVQRDGIILAADSIVVKDGQIFEKPTDRANAIDIIHQLAGDTHVVITGVCLMSAGRTTSFSDHSEVHLASMTNEEIEWYIDTYKPYDKAGAYGIQDWIGHCKVDRIVGSYNNIMGLPTHRVYEALFSF